MEKDFDIVFVKPKKYEDCKKCVEYIKRDKIVHINLMDLDGKESQRILRLLMMHTIMPIFLLIQKMEPIIQLKILCYTKA